MIQEMVKQLHKDHTVEYRNMLRRKYAEAEGDLERQRSLSQAMVRPAYPPELFDILQEASARIVKQPLEPEPKS